MSFPDKRLHNFSYIVMKVHCVTLRRSVFIPFPQGNFEMSFQLEPFKFMTTIELATCMNWSVASNPRRFSLQSDGNGRDFIRREPLS